MWSSSQPESEIETKVLKGKQKNDKGKQRDKCKPCNPGKLMSNLEESKLCWTDA